MSSSKTRIANVKANPRAVQPLAGARLVDLPYQASWVDRLNAWVDGLPVAPWTFYGCLWLLLFILVSGSKWLDGFQPFGQLRWIYVFYPFYGVYFLTAVHYLDRWAKAAFEKFRPALALEEAEQSRLAYELTTMPARAIWILSGVSLAAFLVFLRPAIIPLWESVGIFHRPNTPASTLVDLGLLTPFNVLGATVFVYHTLRQLRWIGRIHNSAARLNLFQLRPLYSLSGLTARTAGILLLLGYLIDLNNRLVEAENLGPNLEAAPISWIFPLITLVFFSLLAAAVFFLPLLGLHQLLLREKERLQAEADTRLQANIHDLHKRIDDLQLQNADAVHYYMSSLALERDILAKLPTWPWQPGTFNLVLTAVLLPIVLWILQQLLERWAGI